VTSSTPALLVGFHYSPWTERARFALDVLGVPYRFIEYVPMVFEPWVRLRARRFTGRLTVPIWIPARGEAVIGSAEIARALDHERRLFPREHDAEIERWVTLLEPGLHAKRVRVVESTARSKPAQEASLPAFLPEVLRPPLRLVTVGALQYFRMKYRTGAPDDGPMVAVLDQIRAHLAGGRRHMVGDAFTFADIAVATFMQAIEPVDATYVPLAESLRDVWREPHLADRYHDLVTFRDELYQAHRAATPR
jgi:glutathione S-transferase